MDFDVVIAGAGPGGPRGSLTAGRRFTAVLCLSWAGAGTLPSGVRYTRRYRTSAPG